MLDFIKTGPSISLSLPFYSGHGNAAAKRQMKKYANLLTGAVLVIAIIEPVTGLFGKTSISHIPTWLQQAVLTKGNRKGKPPV